MPTPGVALLLYAESAKGGGEAAFKITASARVDPSAFDSSYRETDPDVSGEELERTGDLGVERTAAVRLVVQRRQAARG
ncbi:MAG: hypothetical protein JWQ73_1131 [Variovorax sp.]|jgi:hypothetical protein|nr:hypothetical protein [Variovorax sp.]